MKKILVILGHPSKNSFNQALMESYIKGAKKSKFEIRKLILKDMKFDPILHEGYNKIQDLEPDLIEAQKDISWADHIVIIYPIWWGVMPALLKGFLDRTFLPGFAFHFRPGKTLPLQLLKGKSARIISTTGGSRWIYYIFGHPGNKAFSRFTLKFVGISPVKQSIFSSVREDMTKKTALKILKKVEKLGEKGV